MPSETIKIEVTAEDINTGIQSSVKKCPIARAATRNGLIDARVGTALISGYRVNNESQAMSMKFIMGELPPAARAFVADFDHDVHVTPLSFEVTFHDHGDPFEPNNE